MSQQDNFIIIRRKILGSPCFDSLPAARCCEDFLKGFTSSWEKKNISSSETKVTAPTII